MQGDGRYLITNSKDQTIKLWDLRKFSSSRGEKATLDCVKMQMWDYRWESVPNKTRRNAMTKLPGDTSVMSYAGHTVKNTLLRCRFSPAFTTGQVWRIFMSSLLTKWKLITVPVILLFCLELYLHCLCERESHRWVSLKLMVIIF